MVKALWAGLALLAGTGALSAANWKIEMIDQNGAGKFSSLKFDKDGNGHLAYVDGKDTLKYGFWDHVLKRWFLMDVAPGASFTSLVLDSHQRPNISWCDAGSVAGSKLRYAVWDGKTWKKQVIPLNEDEIAYYTSIALDTNDNPSISYYEIDGPHGSGLRVRMRVVTWNGKYWEVRTVDGSNQSGKFNSMASDSQGHLHLAYANVNPGTASVRYAAFDGQWWSPVEMADTREMNELQYVGFGLALTLDKAGDPHLTYMNSSQPAVKYAVRKGGHWRTEVVEPLGGVAYPDRNSITLDEQERPFLAYYDSGRGMLRLAHREGKAWVVETVDTNGCGYTSSLEIDHGVVWITYADEVNGGLKVAHAPFSDFTVGNTSQVEGSTNPLAQSRQ